MFIYIFLFIVQIYLFINVFNINFLIIVKNYINSINLQINNHNAKIHTCLQFY
jgi:hypothetical protein